MHLNPGRTAVAGAPNATASRNAVLAGHGQYNRLIAKVGQYIIGCWEAALAIGDRRPNARVSASDDPGKSALAKAADQSWMTVDLPSLLHAEICENILSRSEERRNLREHIE